MLQEPWLPKPTLCLTKWCLRVTLFTSISQHGQWSSNLLVSMGRPSEHSRQTLHQHDRAFIRHSFFSFFGLKAESPKHQFTWIWHVVVSHLFPKREFNTDGPNRTGYQTTQLVASWFIAWSLMTVWNRPTNKQNNATWSLLEGYPTSNEHWHCFREGGSILQSGKGDPACVSTYIHTSEVCLRNSIIWARASNFFSFSIGNKKKFGPKHPENSILRLSVSSQEISLMHFQVVPFFYCFHCQSKPQRDRPEHCHFGFSHAKTAEQHCMMRAVEALRRCLHSPPRKMSQTPMDIYGCPYDFMQNSKKTQGNGSYFWGSYFWRDLLLSSGVKCSDALVFQVRREAVAAMVALAPGDHVEALATWHLGTLLLEKSKMHLWYVIHELKEVFLWRVSKSPVSLTLLPSYWHFMLSSCNSSGLGRVARFSLLVTCWFTWCPLDMLSWVSFQKPYHCMSLQPSIHSTQHGIQWKMRRTVQTDIHEHFHGCSGFCSSVRLSGALATAFESWIGEPESKGAEKWRSLVHQVMFHWFQSLVCSVGRGSRNFNSPLVANFRTPQPGKGTKGKCH